MEVDEATQATEENVQRHVNAETGAHLEAVIDTLEVLAGPWPGIVAKGQQAADALKSQRADVARRRRVQVGVEGAAASGCFGSRDPCLLVTKKAET